MFLRRIHAGGHVPLHGIVSSDATTPEWRMRMHFLTFDEYLGQIAASGRAYWKKSASERWEYLAAAMGMAQVYMPESLLEIGSAGLKCSRDSIGIDTNRDFPAEVYHDICEVPWPFKDKEFDMVLALQVFEHLKGHQRESFQEVKRVSKSFILSIPYKWKRDPGNCHNNLSESDLYAWTGMHPNCMAIVGHPRRLRLVARYAFE
ncbi:methyltransferase domain-containing protein [Desulfolutivibrio sulfoxidireducens]|nr:methyltransferase domain-containing protein [Desulfolutivibrio sulfoxidireducens]